MTSTTATATAATSSSNTREQHGEPNPVLRPSTNFSCTTCRESFENSQEQRMHMKGSWHINNLKRRVDSLEPVSLEEFQEQIKKTTVVGGKPRAAIVDDETSESDDDDDDPDEWPFRCLFCHRDFAASDVGLRQNLQHMNQAHGMDIPEADKVLDMESFVGYLATEVRLWHECLYCGATKPSTRSVQNHMRDKAHCQLNFDREPELLDFWESSPLKEHDAVLAAGDRPVHLSESEIRFASGKVIASRHASSSTPRSLPRRPKTGTSQGGDLIAVSGPAGRSPDSAPGPPAPQVSTGRQLARREEMALQGLSVQQRQSLVLAEKKAQRSEAVARRAREWVYAKKANAQKFDQVDNQMKWGKQNHKLQPR